MSSASLEAVEPRAGPERGDGRRQLLERRHRTDDGRLVEGAPHHADRMGVGGRARHGEHVVEPPHRGMEVSDEEPDPRDPVGERQRGVGVARVDEPVARGAEVLPFVEEAAAPLRPRPTAQPAPSGLGDAEEPVGVAVPEGVALARLRQPLEAVLPQGLELVVATGLDIGDDERLVDEVQEEVEDLARRQEVVAAHGFGGVERAPAGEDGEPGEQPALVLEQEVVAPVDDGAQRLLPGQRRSGTTGQDAEPVVEQRGQLGERQRPEACRGQLDRQREPVEAPAHVLDHRAVVVVDGEAGLHGERTVGEDVDGGVEREPAHRHQDLARHAQRLAARGEQTEVRRRSPTRASATTAASAMTCSQLSSTTTSERPRRWRTTRSSDDALLPSLRATSRAAATAGVTRGGVAHAGELDDPDAVGRAPPPHAQRGLDGEPGLACAAGTDQRDEP